MLNMNVTVDDDLQSFSIPRKHNHGATAHSSQVFQISDTLQFQKNTTTRMECQKISPFAKYYLCSQNNCKIAHAAQCDKSRALTIVMGSFFQLNRLKTNVW